MDWLDGVAMQLVLLTRRPGGSLRRDGFVDATLRVAVLVDLVLDGRMNITWEPWTVDTEPTGFAPADRLLAEVTRPGLDLDRLIGRGPSLHRAMVEAWVHAGRWWVRKQPPGVGPRRYFGDRDEQARQDRLVDALIEQVDRPMTRTPRVSALAACARIAGLVQESFGRPPADLLHSCGPARALVGYADAFIADSRRRQALADSSVQRTGDGGS